MAWENLIKRNIDPNIPLGQQMTSEALQKYYDEALAGVRIYLDIPPETRKAIMSVARSFEADLPFLTEKGINVDEAQKLFMILNS